MLLYDVCVVCFQCPSLVMDWPPGPLLCLAVTESSTWLGEAAARSVTNNYYNNNINIKFQMEVYVCITICITRKLYMKKNRKNVLILCFLKHVAILVDLYLAMESYL